MGCKIQLTTMQNKRIILTSTILFLFSITVRGQQNYVPTIIAPSPDAVSLGKYGDLPVGQYNGSVGVSVPIYTINVGGVQVPISLSCNTSGIKVEEVSGWTGLGWTLNAGGVIAVSTNGISDFDATAGYLSHSYDLSTFEALSEQDKKDLLVLVNSQNLDINPDLYTYNFNGNSGKFLIDKSTMNAFAIPMNNLLIKLPDSQINRWEIVDANGNRYIFQDREINVSEDVSGHNYSLTPSYYLTKIITSTNREINFNYQSYTNTYYARVSSTRDYFDRNVVGGRVEPGCLQSYNERYSIVSVSGKRIESITWEGGSVKFIKSIETRQDMPGDYFLKAIEVYDARNLLEKKFQMSYGYFETDGGQSFPNQTALMPAKRLKLLSVTEVNSLNIGLPPFQFEYFNGVPYYFSRAQDLWGYYNGAAGNVSLLQKLDGHLGNADRSANENAKAGTLSKIIYPTGGYTQFSFESNDALLPLSEYYKYPYPVYSLTSDPGLVIASIQSNQNIVNFDSEPAILSEDGLKLFAYTIVYPESINCPGTNKDCIGNLSIEIESHDENFYVSIENQLVFENGVATGEIWLPAGKTYRFRRIGGNVFGTVCTLIGKKNPLTHIINGTPYINVKVGGVRLFYQTNVSATGSSVTKKYYYHQNLTTPEGDRFLQPSSGRLSSFPVFGFSSYTSGANYLCTKYTMAAGSMAPMAVNGGGAVGYKYVQEISEVPGTISKTLTEFVSCDIVNDNYSYTYPYINGMSRDYLRGLVLNEKKFRFEDNNFELASEEIFSYNLDSLTVGKSILGCTTGCAEYTYYNTLGFTECNNTIFKQYSVATNWVFKTKSELRIFATPSSFIATSDHYSYKEDNFLVLEHLRIDSKGNETSVKFKYASDFLPASPYAEMIDRNIIAPIVEKTTTDKTNNLELSREKINFELWQNQSLIGVESIQNSVFGNVLETGLTINSYDIYGNVLETVSRDGIVTSYLWGYNNSLPVVKVVGMPLSQIAPLVDMTIMNNVDGSYTDLQIRNEVQNIYNSLSELNAQVFTYTYRPLVGMTSETDPSGRTTFYEYDDFNRLSVVKDQDGKVLRKICYNYAGQPEDCGVIIYQSVEKSGNFTRNNCGGGYTGSTVTYTVSAGTYTSTISLEDANQQAQADVNANGQAYANVNGTCTVTCSSGNCSGVNKKCINNVCETGVPVVIDCEFDTEFNKWRYWYVYQFSDNSWSTYTWYSIEVFPCILD